MPDPCAPTSALDVSVDIIGFAATKKNAREHESAAERGEESNSSTPMSLCLELSPCAEASEQTDGVLEELAGGRAQRCRMTRRHETETRLVAWETGKLERELSAILWGHPVV